MIRSSRVVIFCFDGGTQWRVFLLLYGRHVGAHLDGHQRGMSIQSSINFGETLSE